MLSNKQDLKELNEHKPAWLESFIDVYQKLSPDNLNVLASLYHQDILFQDPMHEIHGLSALQNYFSQLYQNLSSCTFKIDQVLHQGNQAAIYWTMTYCHKQLNRGKPITVEGHSLIMGVDNKVTYHRDYLDLGQMLYQHIPILGRIIKWLNNRVSQ